MKDAADKGMPIQIFRVGLTTEDLKSGKMPKTQWLTKLLKSCYELGAYTSEYLGPIILVDFVAKAVTKLSLKENISNNIFHLLNHRLV